MRNLKRASRKAIAKAFLTHVRPILEYCPTVWHPNQIGFTNDFEIVQRRAVHWVYLNFGRDFSPSLALQNLKWSTLHHRREFFFKVMMYKLHYDIPSLRDLSEALRPPTYMCRNDHQFKIDPPRFRTNVGFYSPVGVGVRLWNLLDKYFFMMAYPVSTHLRTN